MEELVDCTHDANVRHHSCKLMIIFMRYSLRLSFQAGVTRFTKQTKRNIDENRIEKEIGRLHFLTIIQ